MPIQKLSKRAKTLLLACMALAVFAVLYNRIIEPVIGNWKTLNARTETKTALLIKNTRLLRMYRALEGEYAKYRRLVEVSKNEEQVMAKVLKEIENLSQKSACRVINVRPRPSKQRQNFKEIFFDVATVSSTEQLSRFLYEIESSPVSLKVKRFTITSRSGKSDKLKGTFLISKIIFL